MNLTAVQHDWTALTDNMTGDCSYRSSLIRVFISSPRSGEYFTFYTEMNFFSEWKLYVSHRKESVTGSGPNHRFCITTVSLWLVLMAKPSHVLNWTLSSKNKIMLFCTSCPTYLLNIYLSSPELTVSRVPRPKIIFCAFPFTLWLIAE